MKNPFKEKIEEPKNYLGTMDEKPTITLLNAAQEEEQHLLLRIRNLKAFNFKSKQDFRITKGKLRKELDEVAQKKSALQSKYDTEMKHGKITRTKVRVTDAVKLDRLIVEKNTASLLINKETLVVTIPFTNCKHKITPTLNALIPFDKEALWQDIIAGMAIQRQFTCAECRKAKASLRAKFGKWNDRPIGSAIIVIRGLR